MSNSVHQNLYYNRNREGGGAEGIEPGATGGKKWSAIYSACHLLARESENEVEARRVLEFPRDQG